MRVLRLCVLAEGLPAGDDPVARVVAGLSADHEVVVAVADGERPDGAFDVALATSWQATVHLFGIDATRHVELVSGFEFEVMGAWQAERLAAQIALDLPVDFIATDASVRDALVALRPDARVVLARLPLAPAAADVVLEGSPIPAMLAGSAPIVLPSNAGPVEHMVSGLVAQPDDPADLERLRVQLAADPALAARLANGARAAVAGWPVDASEVASALEEIVASPPPEASRWPHRLMGDLMAGIALLRQDHFTAAAYIKRLESENAEPLRTFARRTKNRLR
jgi:hypothetical protein